LTASVLALILASVLLVTVPAPVSRSQMLSTLPQPRHLNAHAVTPQLLVGGDLSADPALAQRQLAELVDLGVTHVFDARVEWSDESLVRRHAPDVAYHHVGIDDAGQRVPDEWFDDVVGRAQTALADGGRVLAHCHMGINRGPSLGVAVLLAEGWDVVEAMTAVRTARPIAAMAYAEDALAWHHRRSDATTDRIADDRRRVAAWRAAHPLDVVRIIRAQRAAGA
jgi:dual specificity phosphatase 3